ncbi:MAG: hypothetical protein KGD60_08860 [Candidatus Thorarchaeota archaeon]|nr:hypothetical protein [Candidatus Thorarchaeota archaeon]
MPSKGWNDSRKLMSTPECADAVRELFGRGCRLERIRDRVFPNLDQQKPYTAFMTQKELVNNCPLEFRRVRMSGMNIIDFGRRSEVELMVTDAMKTLN